MLATADDVRLYQTLMEYCKDLKLVISLNGDAFSITTLKGELLGNINNLDQLAHYIYGYEAGYEAGFSKGKNTKIKYERKNRQITQ